ncbi:hypothetical protein MesoLj131c_65740 (plasmid) [Mesorhizobium sp. 131-3-5]|nr:hypothetical protein MesoLj131c_65740 [Mesorhizobium sp. 131-3-5]
MFGQLIDVAAQSDTAAADSYGWLKNYRQPKFIGRAFYVRRIPCQAIRRHLNAGPREELTLGEFVATSFNQCGFWPR